MRDRMQMEEIIAESGTERNRATIENDALRRGDPIAC
jgi:hypothetical protein